MNAVSTWAVLVLVLGCAGLATWRSVRAEDTDGVPRYLPAVEEPLLADRARAEAFCGYDYGTPTRSFHLPKDLTELSALTDVDANTVAGVQDEQGVVFFIDVHTGQVKHRVPFGDAGDYEGLTRVGQALWVLRSDGWLAEIVQQGSRFTIRRDFQLELAHQDFEGLGYDPNRQRLLVAPKDRPSGDKEEKVRRRVYLFDPQTGNLDETAALDTTLPRMRGDGVERGLALPERVTKKGNVKSTLQLRFSSIALHPVTGELYALSASDDALFAFDRESRLTATHLFRGPGMEQVEGMTFLPNGDLVIASEGVDRPAQMQVFAARWDAPKHNQSSQPDQPQQQNAPIDE